MYVWLQILALARIAASTICVEGDTQESHHLKWLYEKLTWYALYVVPCRTVPHYRQSNGPEHRYISDDPTTYL